MSAILTTPLIEGETVLNASRRNAPQLEDPAASASMLAESVSRLEPIGLTDLLNDAALQTRTDLKYLIPTDVFGTFTQLMSQEIVALDIDGRRLFDYESVYFDSPDLATYRAHLQRRRRRFKLRTRTYLDSEECMLEVKLEGRRAVTVKHRVPYPIDHRDHLTGEGREFLQELLADAYGMSPPTELAPVMTTRYRRATLACRHEPARLTCDVGLVCHTPQRTGPDQGLQAARELRARGNYVLVESKSIGGSIADRKLREMGIRPISVSKYCVGIAGLHPEMTSNPWRRTLRRHFEIHPAEETYPSAASAGCPL